MEGLILMMRLRSLNMSRSVRVSASKLFFTLKQMVEDRRVQSENSFESVDMALAIAERLLVATLFEPSWREKRNPWKSRTRMCMLRSFTYSGLPSIQTP